MVKKAAVGLLAGLGLMHLVPGVVAITPRAARTAYGVEASDPDLTLLLRHRAVLLAAVGTGLIAGAFAAPVRPAAVTFGGISMASFVALARGNPGLRRQTRRVVRADIAGLAALAAAGLVQLSDRSEQP